MSNSVKEKTNAKQSVSDNGKGKKRKTSTDAKQVAELKNKIHSLEKENSENSKKTSSILLKT